MVDHTKLVSSVHNTGKELTTGHDKMEEEGKGKYIHLKGRRWRGGERREEGREGGGEGGGEEGGEEGGEGGGEGG